jgi:hypothetical protein
MVSFYPFRETSPHQHQTIINAAAAVIPILYLTMKAD